jgi:hypothetical protein
MVLISCFLSSRLASLSAFLCSQSVTLSAFLSSCLASIFAPLVLTSAFISANILSMAQGILLFVLLLVPFSLYDTVTAQFNPIIDQVDQI